MLQTFLRRNAANPCGWEGARWLPRPLPTATSCSLLAQECLHELEPQLPAVRRRRVSKRHEEPDQQAFRL